MARSVPFVSLLFLAPVAGCRLPFGEACTTVFANVQLVVLDTTGTPLGGLTIVDTVLRTHRSFTVNQDPYWSGSYDVFDDGDKDVIRSGGDAVRVTGSGSAKFSAAFMFNADACHVGKVSGPDTVVAR